MIELLFSKINRLKNVLTKASALSSVDMYGDGVLGNVFYGSPDSTVPSGYDTVFNSANQYNVLYDSPLHYKNLYIDTNVSLGSMSDAVTILVNDTLYLYGNISLSNTHSGNYSASKNIPSSYEQFVMYGESSPLNKSNFFITGGAGNPMFGNASNGGGCLVVYYSNLKDSNGTDRGTNWGTSLKLLGGSGQTGTAGGCLIIAARTVELGPAGSLDVSGGDNSNTTTKGISLMYKLVR